MLTQNSPSLALSLSLKAVQGSGWLGFGLDPHLTRLARAAEKLTRTQPNIRVGSVNLGHLLDRSDSTVWWVQTTNLAKFLAFHGFYFFGAFLAKINGLSKLQGFKSFSILPYQIGPLFYFIYFKMALQALLEAILVQINISLYLLNWAFKLCLKQYRSKLILPSPHILGTKNTQNIDNWELKLHRIAVKPRQNNKQIKTQNTVIYHLLNINSM